MNTQTNPLLTETKNQFYQWLSLSTGITILLFCFLNIVMLHEFQVGIVQATLGSLNLYFFWSANQKKKQRWHSHALIATLTITILDAFYFTDLRSGSIYWLIILPPIYCILVGARIGFIYTIILSFPAVLILFMKSDNNLSMSYRSAINFALAYFLAYLICYYYSEQYKKHSILLHQMAFKDSLTGAKNRHALKLFFDHFSQKKLISSEEEENPRLVVVDIDYFKSVNDRFGHDVGDVILMETSNLLKNFTGDDTVYRIGGEEFLIILHGMTCVKSLEFAEKLRQHIESHIFRSHEHEITLTVSIGVARLSTGKTYKDFLQEADQNLYAAKSKGRNRVYHTSLDE